MPEAANSRLDNKMGMSEVIKLPLEGFLRLRDVLRLIPISKSSWWKGVETGRYPKSVKLGPHTTAWRVEDIRRLMELMV